MGLRVFERGFAAAYTEQSNSRGLMPDIFHRYKIRRYPWAFGRVRILAPT